jgi:predicted alpha/beta hydrolase
LQTNTHKEKKMKKFFGFMASTAGRILRAAAGGVLIGLGLGLVKGNGGWVMLAVGAVLVLVGLLDVCLFAPLFGKPFTGKHLREWAKS